ncbi:hypothetical protein DUI87_10278 [Hirundo rustica rustica]|uniref:Nucleoprotein n=1 Tax=Hirundo rustica rustica TaxID=333673 RepID=A0A3M0KI51_HIRRU|nr:hypothetical protein DUI87_10278 [Hirundo rustica rustica]
MTKFSSPMSQVIIDQHCQVLSSLELPQTGVQVAAPPVPVGHVPALLMLYNNNMRMAMGPLTTGISIITAVFPAFRTFFPVDEKVTKPDGTAAKWIRDNYGTASCRIPAVPDDHDHRLGLYHAACTLLTAVFRDSRDGSHIRTAESRFNAFKAAANISTTHSPYQALDTPAFVSWIAGQPWAHQTLIQVLGEQVPGVGANLMAQMDMVAREGQITALNAINTFLKEVDSGLILLPGVIDDIPKFQEAWKKLEQAVSPQWFPYIRATYHPEAKKISPNSFLKLASAALYHTAETNATMRQRSQGKPIAGGIPESKLREAFRKKLRRTGADLLTTEQKKILSQFGITNEIIMKTLSSKK